MKTCGLAVVVVALQPRICLAQRPAGSSNRAQPAPALILADTSFSEPNQTVAGTPPTAIIQVAPVSAKVGSYPPGTAIVGNELRAPFGGFRAWFEFQVGNWDPNRDGTPTLYVVQIKIDASGYRGSDAPGDQADLVPALVSCTEDVVCVESFGESWAKCESGHCKPAYADLEGGHPDSFCADTGFGHCEYAACSTASLNASCYAVYPWHNGYRHDDGSVRYVATLVLDVPAGARGRYEVDVNADETFSCGDLFCDTDLTFGQTGFIVNIQTGACCYDLGSDSPSCVDGVLASECGDDEPGPVYFTPDAACPQAGADCDEHIGACCDRHDGVCTERTLEAACLGPRYAWSAATSCDEASCEEASGACCELFSARGICRQGRTLAECGCENCTWTLDGRCIDVACDPPFPVPAVSRKWWMMTAGLFIIGLAWAWRTRASSKLTMGSRLR